MFRMVTMLGVLIIGTRTTALKCYTCTGIFNIIDCPLQNCSDGKALSEIENDTFGCYLQLTKNSKVVKRGCFSMYEWPNIQNVKDPSIKYGFCYENSCNVDFNRFAVNDRENVQMTTLKPDNNNTFSTNPNETIGTILGIALFAILICCCCWFSILRYDKKRRRKNATGTSNTRHNDDNYSTDPYINDASFVALDLYSTRHNSSYKNVGDSQCDDNSKNNDSKNDHCGNNDSGGDGDCECGGDDGGCDD